MSDFQDPDSMPGTSATQPSREAIDQERVLLTGASGFVGGYVLRELLARGYRPVCLIRPPRELAARLPSQIAAECDVQAGDLFDAPTLDRAAGGCVAVIHLVGIIEEKTGAGVTFERIHVEGTRNVLRACRSAGIYRYVHMSALGSRPDAPSRYHRSKWQAEELVRQSGLAWTVFRPSLIHGPEGEFMRLMKSFCTGGLRQPVMPYFGSGNARLQPVSVRDVATCFVAALSKAETVGKTYELGGPTQYTWREFYDICAEAIIGHRRVKVPVPVFMAKLMARTIVPLTPSFLMPHKFNVEQVQMSQEDNLCDTGPVERDFGMTLRDFRTELAEYANRIP
ncbi:MAG: complex I NDUFA9 subunit family protein [Phycisphaerae bacterium]|nr:complex I NDUFA9 subunit family protein [Phycisphaerae bacterium]